ncbi:hypothetical protein Pla52n_45600 [Stieleria varia]|uniref:Uncharacterized protein n=1 Tax=Stieleria varia TaxID=2528005 RepID=A0A5C6ANU9_9BACT|nr:hypothetical protein Pla52n_45600 [Stieleria varia]
MGRRKCLILPTFPTNTVVGAKKNRVGASSDAVTFVDWGALLRGAVIRKKTSDAS